METRNNQTVAFTGHRKERILQGSGNDSRILAQIREAVTGVVTELYGQGYKEYYTGMASGFDMTAAEAVLQVSAPVEGLYCAGDTIGNRYINQGGEKLECINDFSWAFASGYLAGNKMLEYLG